MDVYTALKNIRSWCDGSSDRSFVVDPLSYFSFQAVLHDCLNKCLLLYKCQGFLLLLLFLCEHNLFNVVLIAEINYYY